MTTFCKYIYRLHYELDATVDSLIAAYRAERDKIRINLSSRLSRICAEARELITPCGEKIHLTGREYPFLQALAEANNTHVSRTTLLQKLGYPLDEYGNRSLESLIYRLRKKISPNLETPIKTVNATGYTFTAKIEIEN